MKLFGRKNSDQNAVPADLQQYYSSGGSNAGKWILRVGLFVVVLAILVGGGIWLFNKLSDKNSTTATQSTSSQQEAERKAAEDKTKAEDAAKKAAEEAKAAEARKKAADELARKKAAEGTNQGAATPTTGADGVSGSTTSPQSTSTTELPNSGPGAILAGLFAGATAFGTLLHSIFLRRRQTR
ncbi:MAG: hypothetical protein JWP13_840 [Candidatus Saccharibacteria bacterium]|nr:hypothetical protein [Candidatus Saccharibacteria bacterium]